LSGNVVEYTISGAGIARINSANIVVVANFADVNTNSAGKIARICGTCIVIITLNRSVDAISSICITGIDGAFVSIITKNLFNNTFSGCLIARRWEALINSLAINWGEYTTRSSIARISGTCVVVITKYRGLDEVSSQNITSVIIALVLLAKSFDVILWRVNTSFNSITSIFSARIDISTDDRSMDAFSSIYIT
jgi:hypothetical protein